LLHKVIDKEEGSSSGEGGGVKGVATEGGKGGNAKKDNAQNQKAEEESSRTTLQTKVALIFCDRDQYMAGKKPAEGQNLGGALKLKMGATIQNTD
jgi:hypothetical protein